MVSCYGYVISRRWSSHFWVKVHVFSNFFSTVKEILGLRSCKALIYVLFFTSSTKKSPFLAVLTWFLILGKIQDGDHCWWRHRPPAAPPPIKCTSSCKEDQRPSTEEKIVSKYCNKPKTLGGMVSSTTTPCTTVGVCVRPGVKLLLSTWLVNCFDGIGCLSV